MKRLFQKINFIFAQLSGFSLVFIIVFVLIDIVGRIMDKPVLGSSELAIFSMLIAVYLGMPYCEEQKEHVAEFHLIHSILFLFFLFDIHIFSYFSFIQVL